jgi:DNA-binding LacI/PurR family transcriptional regulator
MAERTRYTIADIARVAGVSKSTVSRALNDSPLIGAETKQRIREVAREHDFQMNDAARRLSLKRSHAIALVTYAYKAEFSVPDAFMLEIMSGISSGLHANGYDLLVIQVAPHDSGWAHRYLETGRVDGFILLSASCTQDHIATLVDMRAPFIIWGAPPGSYGCSSVSGDSFAGGRLATAHLLRSGRQRVAFLGGPAREPEIQDRYRGYETALHDGAIPIDADLVAYADYSDISAAAIMHELLERAPDLDAVFVNSDLMALAALRAIREHGRRVPDDIAVVGYDDISLARYSDPPLTTIRQNGPLAGRLLAQNLIQHLQSGVVTSVTIPAELVVRGSA